MNLFTADVIERFAQRVYRVKDPITGADMPMPLERIQLTPWAYVLTFTGLAQNGVATQALNIQANSDFCLTSLSLRASVAAAVGQQNANEPIPFVRLLLTDSGTNEQLTASPVDAATYCNIPGSGIDMSLAYPRLLTGRSSLTVQATNYAPAAETYTFDLVFSGVNMRIYG